MSVFVIINSVHLNLVCVLILFCSKTRSVILASSHSCFRYFCKSNKPQYILLLLFVCLFLFVFVVVVLVVVVCVCVLLLLLLLLILTVNQI